MAKRPTEGAKEAQQARKIAKELGLDADELAKERQAFDEKLKTARRRARFARVARQSSAE
jgi:hypothetical protein